MSALFTKAYAKVNLCLDVVGKREDGYHELRGVMQQISLADDLWAREADDISIRCNIPYIPTDERNILWKVAKAFFDYADIRGKGVSFTLHKRVPSGAGLGGGSSDGASALKLLDKLYQTHLTDAQLIEIATPIGADIPFFIKGGTALAEGIGERLTQLPSMKQGVLLLIKPPFSLPTPKIFAQMDQMDDYPHPSADEMISALRGGNLVAVADAMGNSMQAAVEKLHPEIAVLCQRLKSAGAMNAIMTGSGSTVFGLFDSMKAAKRAALTLIGDRCDYYIVTPRE